MASARRVPEATVARLPVYLRVLSDAAGGRTATISSEDLAVGAGVNAAQVRKDLSHLGSYGTRGVGYDVTYLVREIRRELGLSEVRRVCIVGMGNLGRALACYGGFASRGFAVVAGLDADPAKVGERVGSVVVEPVATLRDVVARERVEMAVITIPASAAQGAVDAVVEAGIASILNFAPTTVRVPSSVALRHVDLGTELQILSFYGHHASQSAAPTSPAAGREAPEQEAPAVTASLTRGAALARDSAGPGGMTA